jgi:hypothetical protein
MEKADIPTRAQRIQKLHKSTWPFWENEPVDKFIFYFWPASNLKFDVHGVIRQWHILNT